SLLLAAPSLSLYSSAGFNAAAGCSRAVYAGFAQPRGQARAHRYDSRLFPPRWCGFGGLLARTVFSRTAASVLTRGRPYDGRCMCVSSLGDTLPRPFSLARCSASSLVL